jgi:hypothetical protein
MADRLHDNSQEWSRLYFNGCVAVIGLPFLLLGLCLMAGPLLPGQEIRGPWYLEVWGGPRRARTVHTVRLAAHSHTILVDGFQAYPDARRLAEELSVFCALELADGCLMGLAVVLLVRAGWRVLGPAGRLKVTASRSQLTCERYGLLGHRTRTMRADEMEELTISDRGIIARSDDQTIAFGAGLPVHELKRIHAELVALLG